VGRLGEWGRPARRLMVEWLGTWWAGWERGGPMVLVGWTYFISDKISRRSSSKFQLKSVTEKNGR
jgi:hypothetical protein